MSENEIIQFKIICIDVYFSRHEIKNDPTYFFIAYD